MSKWGQNIILQTILYYTTEQTLFTFNKHYQKNVKCCILGGLPTKYSCTTSETPGAVISASKGEHDFQRLSYFMVESCSAKTNTAVQIILPTCMATGYGNTYWGCLKGIYFNENPRFESAAFGLDSTVRVVYATRTMSQGYPQQFFF